MSKEYKCLTGIDLIRGFCAKILAYGIREKLDIDGVKIWLPIRLIKDLELDDSLLVEYEGNTFEIPVVESDSEEIPLEDGRYQADIRAGNPEWKIGVAEGELWFEPRI